MVNTQQQKMKKPSLCAASFLVYEQKTISLSLKLSVSLSPSMCFLARGETHGQGL
jgi:hypothetical protein